MQLYDKLLTFPLFLGMGRGDLEQIAGHTKFDFFKAQEGKTVVRVGEACNRLIMMTNGRMEMLKYADDYGYNVVETADAPHVIQPQNLFGLQQRFTATFTAVADCNFISLSKAETVKLCDNFMVFRINYMNLLAMSAQKASSLPWKHLGSDNRQRITAFLFAHCAHPAGPKRFNILMERLAKEINASRLDVSVELNKMKDEGLISLGRGRIIIPSMERLV